ncbi:MAG TPA: hypothetical protein PLO71_11770, partial [Thauera phenylacetica]|nr:hypothetical protein [Thauera phenylacetica]
MRHALPAAELFKAYDIRGIVDTVLTPAAVRAIGHALGSEAVARGQRAIAVKGDVADPQTAQDFVAKAVEAFGK